MPIYDPVTRRSLLVWTAGVALLHEPTYAFATDFWNTKAPASWTDDEIRQLLTKSPWSKHISIDVEDGLLRNWTGRGARNAPGQSGQAGPPARTADEPIPMSHQVGGTVRWESAQVVRDATKGPLPRQFAHHYAISLTGFNLGAPNPSIYPDGADPSNFTKTFLDHIKAASSLKNKGNTALATLVHGAGSAVLLGFAKSSMQLSLEDQHVDFATTIGKLSVKTKFDLKEMTYHETLAV
jgi:hypothetical protein